MEFEKESIMYLINTDPRTIVLILCLGIFLDCGNPRPMVPWSNTYTLSFDLYAENLYFGSVGGAEL